jgi:hypothetical protein
MADCLNQIGTRTFTECLGHGLSLVTVAGIQPDLDEFVMIQGQFDFLQDSRAEAMLASQYNGFQGVGFGPEKLLQFRFQLVFLSANE